MKKLFFSLAVVALLSFWGCAPDEGYENDELDVEVEEEPLDETHDMGPDEPD